MARREGLPEHLQPTSGTTIAAWVGVLGALAVGALAVRRRRRG